MIATNALTHNVTVVNGDAGTLLKRGAHDIPPQGASLLIVDVGDAAYLAAPLRVCRWLRMLALRTLGPGGVVMPRAASMMVVGVQLGVDVGGIAGMGVDVGAMAAFWYEKGGWGGY